MHTLFNREHNRIAAALKSLNPTWSDNALYYEARRINIAQYQHIIFNEWLPVATGSASLKPLTSGFYSGYNNAVHN